MLKATKHLSSQTRKAVEHAGKNRPFFDNEYFQSDKFSKRINNTKNGLIVAS
jgi:hypothetical protein